ncbi:MAG TPA: hybrid sensor histidine kinase/response regulator, partial [Steroidobacteraceae bacterium]|nr:hybrid sensor histidine kinase/response regulator [Steroidobacteraceae bacterium]
EDDYDAVEIVPMTADVKCLLVDDIEENLLVLSALLRREDVEILQARSGAEALELLLVHEVALALLDVQMPEMDGFELAELMRGSDRTRHVPIIFVTAGVRDYYRVFKGYETGAVDFLHKPIDPHIIKSKADVFFQLYRQKRQLADQLRELTETLRLNELFTAVLGHDLRNPLGAILNSANLLERVSKDDVVRQSAARMADSGRRMSRMIEDMLDLTRARLGGGIPLRPQECDLGQILQRVLQEHAGALAEGRFDIAQEGELAGFWDADRLAQVASNLVGNALEHGQAGEPIRVSLQGLHPELVSFSVTNEGEVPPQVLPQLFDPFRGAQRHLGRSEGLGLGLYIVQQIVLAHSGRVDVQSDGQRTSFVVQLPRRSEASPAGPTIPA